MTVKQSMIQTLIDKGEDGSFLGQLTFGVGGGVRGRIRFWKENPEVVEVATEGATEQGHKMIVPILIPCEEISSCMLVDAEMEKVLSQQQRAPAGRGGLYVPGRN